MTYDFIELAPQVATAEWGWTIALFLWFIGLAGMGIFLNAWIRSKIVFYTCTVSAIIGTLFVLSHLHRLLNLPFAAIDALINWKFNFASWMFIGICILAVLCVVAIIESWLLYRGNEMAFTCPFMKWFNAALGVAATAYSGFLLTQAVGVPLWTTGVLPVLWIFSGLACAVGLTEVLVSTGKLGEQNLSWLPTTANFVHIGEAFVIFAFVQVAFFGTPGAVAGAKSMLCGPSAGLFWGGAIGLGILLPMILGLTKTHSLKLIGGVCAIFGALFLRAAVLFSGYFDPIIF